MENLSHGLAEVSVEKGLEFSEELLLNVANVWERCSLDQKQRLQGFSFPRVSNTLRAFIELSKAAFFIRAYQSL
jgi:hypothetical protein